MTHGEMRGFLDGCSGVPRAFLLADGAKLQAVGEIEKLGEALESKVTVGGNEAGGCGNGSEEDDGEDKKVLDALEDFFSAPEFTGYVRKFVEENVGNFVFVEDGEEQPLW
jgi:hypothetical protein